MEMTIDQLKIFVNLSDLSDFNIFKTYFSFLWKIHVIAKNLIKAVWKEETANLWEDGLEISSPKVIANEKLKLFALIS